MEASVDPRDSRYIEALKVLLELIRKDCKINAKTRLLVGYTTGEKADGQENRGLPPLDPMRIRRSGNTGRQRSLSKVSARA
jgi:hypothetical protein